MCMHIVHEGIKESQFSDKKESCLLFFHAHTHEHVVAQTTDIRIIHDKKTTNENVKFGIDCTKLYIIGP